MMDWDATSIVFTKRTLMEFLKYTGTTVDTNFNNIQKLPRYAKFGKISDGAAPAVAPVASTPSSNKEGPASASPSSDFKPTRRVRDPPGGARTNIFADEEVPDALSTAPPKAEAAATSYASTAVDVPVAAAAVSDETEEKSEGNATGTGIKPSRRVREAPGGNSSLGSIWGDDKVEEFKPTRRVRQAPGGGVSGIF
ncbi:hypothetical protein MVEN_02077000 [Mycena venus]|uniref:Microtubule-associated protein Jupiter n=1 Tax=Mycena venus TaxID=2733690 RepID=A0A8H6XDK2_9AGAR|nr:hypothetical protein MVEN_02077000 [Mycena venus]